MPESSSRAATIGSMVVALAPGAFSQTPALVPNIAAGSSQVGHVSSSADAQNSDAWSEDWQAVRWLLVQLAQSHGLALLSSELDGTLLTWGDKDAMLCATLSRDAGEHYWWLIHLRDGQYIDSELQRLRYPVCSRLRSAMESIRRDRDELKYDARAVEQGGTYAA